jgi:hypothetical protein
MERVWKRWLLEGGQWERHGDIKGQLVSGSLFG